MPDDEKEEIAESQISKRDRREIEEGACVNCAIASFVVMFLTFIAMIL